MLAERGDQHGDPGQIPESEGSGDLAQTWERIRPPRFPLLVPQRVVEPVSWVAHAPFVMWLVEHWQPRSIVVDGVGSGNSLLAICQAVKMVGMQAAVVGIDSWGDETDPVRSGKVMYDAIRSECASSYGSFASLRRQDLSEALKSMPDGSIDLLHLDGDVPLEDARYRYQAWLPKMSDQGVILLHCTQVHQPGSDGASRVWAEAKRYYPHSEFAHGKGLGVLFVGRALSQLRARLRDALSGVDGASQVGGLFASFGGLLATEREAALRLASIAEDMRIVARELESRGTALARLQAILETVRADRDRVKMRAVQAEGFERALGDARQELDALRLNLAGVQAALEAQEQHQAELSAQREALAAELERARSELGAQFAAAAAHTSEMNATRAALQSTRHESESLNAALRSAQSSLDARDAEIGLLRAALAGAEAVHREAVREIERKLQVAAQQLNDRDRELEARDRELEARDRELEARDRELEARGRELNDRDRELEARGRELNDRDRELEARDRELEARNRDCTGLQADVASRSAHIHELELACGDRERRIAELSVELDRMLRSSSWRLTAPLRELRRHLISRPYAAARRAAARAARSCWRSLPLSDRRRHDLRDWLLEHCGLLLGRTDVGRAWKGVRVLRPGQAGYKSVTAPVLPRGGALIPEAQSVRLIAMYLPQFHRIRENDAWWGPGFTEWTNVRRAKPFYDGHDHPVVPHPDVGYYDLDDPEVMLRQAEMARRFGIHGFCFYYYWFGGRRLLERPLDRWLASGRPDFPFCICWANEDWTRTWDGRSSEVLAKQCHSPENDERFILDVIPLMRDRRYIRVDGRPLLAIYRPALMPDPKATAERWRAVCRREGLGEVHLVSVRSFDRVDPRDVGFDATIQFPPLQIPARNRASDAGFAHDPSFAGIVLDYEDAVQFSCAESAAGYQMYRGVMPSWDNTARRMERATSWINSSPDRYRRWLERAIQQTVAEHQGDHRIVFVNAWNEWAEGAYLEPDTRYGYGRLACTAAAVGSPVHGLPPGSWQADSLPSDMPRLRDWMWRRLRAACAGELDAARMGFLADYVSVLEFASRQGCRLTGRGDVLHARVGDQSVEIGSRVGLARLLDLLDADEPHRPFCFVVLQFNKWEVTERCLTSIKAIQSQRPLHVVVVDNGSEQSVIDASERAISTMPNAHLLSVGRNAGFAAGNNIGYRYARDTLHARFVAVINNDTRIDDPSFVTKCESIYREWGCSALGPDVVTPDGRHENPWADKVYSPESWREAERLYREDFAHFQATGEARWRRAGTRTPSCEVLLNPILQGAALVLTPAFVHTENSLFDERTSLYGEEFLLAVRSLLRGHLSLYSSSVRILHEEGVTTSGIMPAEKMRLGYLNAGAAAAIAGIELDNALCAADGTPVDCRDPALLQTLDAGRREVLVDLLFCQPGYHGGGEYGKAVFRGLLHSAAARTDTRIWAALDPSQFIEPWVLEECHRAGVRIIKVRSYDDIVRLVNSDRFNSFFCPAVVVYTGYEYMKRPGGRLPFTCARTRVIATLHDIRDLQLAERRGSILQHLEVLGVDRARLVAQEGSFLSAQAPKPRDLAPMYAEICSSDQLTELITVSEFCRRSVVERFPLADRGIRVLAPPERPRVSPTSVDVHGLTGDASPYAVMVSAGRSEKNALSVLLAFERLASGGASRAVPAGLKLVLVGARSFQECGLREMRHSERIVCLPYLPADELEHLIANSRFLLYPSFNEGFGYPPLEAMRYAVPSVVSRASSIPEVCGEAAVYCDPMDVESIAAAMARVLTNPPDRAALIAQYELMSERQRRDLAVLVDLIIG